MGGTASVQQVSNEEIMKKTRSEIVRSLLPIYYTKEELTTVEKSLVYDCFQIIIKGEAEKYRETYHEIKKCPAYYFGTLFFGRLFETNSSVRGMFTRDMHKMSHQVVEMFSMLIKEIAGPPEVDELGNIVPKNNNKWIKAVEVVAKSHNIKGIRAFEYGVFGEIFFWTVKTVVGANHYPPATHTAFIKFYSKLLSVIIPIVVDYERNHPKELEAHEAARRKLIAPPNQSFEGLNTGNLNFKRDEEKGGESMYIHHEESSVPRAAEHVTSSASSTSGPHADAQPK